MSLSMYPPEMDCIIGCIESATFDVKGGEYHSHEHGVTVIVPSGAIPVGVVSEMKLAATLTATVQPSINGIPVSAIVWLCMNVTLQKPIMLQIPHYVNIKSKAQSKNLQFAKAKFHKSSTKIMRNMEVIKGGDFPVGGSYGMIEINHFCYYCIELYQTSDNIPEYSYRVVTMKERQPNLITKLWQINVCIIPTLDTCLKVHTEYIMLCIYMNLHSYYLTTYSYALF